MFDLVIRNGTVLDGSGSARRVADVAVHGYYGLTSLQAQNMTIVLI